MLGAFFLLMMTVSAGEVALRVYSAKKCREVCSLTSNCAHYSHQQKNGYGYCKLKQASGWTAYESYGTTSGNRDGSKIRENTYYSGGAVYWDNQNKGLYPRNHSEDCRKICAAMRTCWYYTYCQGVCYFKNQTGWTKKSDYKCKSGDYQGDHVYPGIAYDGGDTY